MFVIKQEAGCSSVLHLTANFVVKIYGALYTELFLVRLLCKVRAQGRLVLWHSGFINREPWTSREQPRATAQWRYLRWPLPATAWDHCNLVRRIGHYYISRSRSVPFQRALLLLTFVFKNQTPFHTRHADNTSSYKRMIVLRAFCYEHRDARCVYNK